jgi:hypothetical protein
LGCDRNADRFDGSSVLLKIHQGLAHIGEDGKEEKTPDTLATRFVQMVIDFSIKHNLPSILTLNAFFP